MARFYQFQYHFIKQRLAVPLRFFSRTRDNVDRWYIRVIKATHYHGQYSINQYSNHNNIERLNRLHCVRDTCHCLNVFQRGNYVDSQEIRIAKFMSRFFHTDDLAQIKASRGPIFMVADGSEDISSRHYMVVLFQYIGKDTTWSYFVAS